MSAVAWPVGADLTTWLGTDTSTAQAAAPFVSDLMETVKRLAVRRIYPDTMPANYDPDASDLGGDTCWPDIRDALILDGARLLTRRHSANGVIATQELLVRVSGADADVERMLHEYVYQPEA